MGDSKSTSESRELTYEVCRNQITDALSPHFRKIIKSISLLPPKRTVGPVNEAVVSSYNVLKNMVEKVTGNDDDAFKHLFPRVRHLAGRLVFASDLLPQISSLIENTLKISFVLLDSLDEESNEVNSMKINQIKRAAETFEYLVNVDRFNVDHIVDAAMRHAVKDIISEIVRLHCEYPIEEPLLETLALKYQVLDKWASRMGLEQKMASIRNQIQSVTEKCVIINLAEKIYDLVIVKYPESGGIIDELRYCMQNNGGFGRSELVEILSSDVQEKLLNVGVGTTNILQGYASAIECLRRLDPTCVIMQRICSIIRNYIKQRSDTVRCIITYITGEKRDELSEQLTKRRTAIVDEEELMGVNDELVPGADDVLELGWREWMPDPPDANPTQSRRFRQNADVFNMLVSVYGSKELFVKEYRELLAERLTKAWNRDPQFEQRYLELLKLRFSEGELQQCEVMLKDMRDSEYIDRLVSSSLPFPVSARITSSFFWPKIENEHFKMPLQMMTGLNMYAQKFEVHRHSRKLEWMVSVGLVEIDLELDGLKVSIAASPAHVAILALFLRKEVWTVDEMCTELEMEKQNLRKRLEWWQNSGIVHCLLRNDCTETWHLASGSMKMDRLRSEYDLDEELTDDEHGEDSIAVDALEQYWTYTKSFIANQEPIKAERLHSIFRMFSSPGQQGPALEDVVAFLQRKVKLNLLTCANGLYKVVKDTGAQ